MLGLDWTQALYGSVENAYQAYYDVEEQEIDNIKEIIFSQIPPWLKAKKK